MLKYALPLIFLVRASAVYALLKRRLAEIIPLNTLIGIEVVSIGDGIAEALLPFRREICNHLDTVHATAIFGLAEAASGYAMSGAFAPDILSVRPIAANADIKFLKAARTALTAQARCAETSQELRAKLAVSGKVVFDVLVDVKDISGAEIAKGTVCWHVTTRKDAAR